MPPIDQRAYFHDYLMLLAIMTSAPRTRAQRDASAEKLRATNDPIASALADGDQLDAVELLSLYGRRAQAQQHWREFFSSWDVLVCPTALDAAFPHADGPQEQRTIDVDGVALSYRDNIVFPMWASTPDFLPPHSQREQTQQGFRSASKRSVRTWRTAPPFDSRSSSNEGGAASKPRPDTEASVFVANSTTSLSSSSPSRNLLD